MESMSFFSAASSRDSSLMTLAVPLRWEELTFLTLNAPRIASFMWFLHIPHIIPSIFKSVSYMIVSLRCSLTRLWQLPRMAQLEQPQPQKDLPCRFSRTRCIIMRATMAMSAIQMRIVESPAARDSGMQITPLRKIIPMLTGQGALRPCRRVRKLPCRALPA